MTVNKLQRFAENEEMDHVLEHPDFEDASQKPKDRWQEHVFENKNPLTIELGCGKGNLTTSLASLHANQNYIGIDIKGARLWKGAKRVEKEDLGNARFLRIQIEQLTAYFGEDEVADIWITFPDPWPRQRDRKKRLTSPRFLKMYQKVLKPKGSVHLKTDNDDLFEYTLQAISSFNGTILQKVAPLYKKELRTNREELKIQTDFEKKHLAKGKTIKYGKFSL